MNGFLFILFTTLITTSLMLLYPSGISEASHSTNGKGIYNQLVREYDMDKGKLDEGEAVNKLELMFKGYALDAVDVTKQNFNKHLDFSEESIKDVEACLDILSKTREKYKPSDEETLIMAKTYAGYIGQVIKLRWGGDWKDEKDYSFDNGPALKVKETHLFLVSKVYRRIVNGPEDNVWHSYLSFKMEQEGK
ncbi:MAG: hypothetical protein H6Q73_2746 [Firmicutes bacterium]|nr:hypothetical protein [Bacillota bacterium]